MFGLVVATVVKIETHRAIEEELVEAHLCRCAAHHKEQRQANEFFHNIYPKKAKRSGAYETAAYDTHPYVLTNYTDNLESCFTLIHELGHAMHSYFTNKTQPYTKSDYSIYLAEIASTVNEILLLKHLFNKASDRQDVVLILDNKSKHLIVNPSKLYSSLILLIAL